MFARALSFLQIPPACLWLYPMLRSKPFNPSEKKVYPRKEEKLQL